MADSASSFVYFLFSSMRFVNWKSNLEFEMSVETDLDRQAILEK